MIVKVKICGITNKEDALSAVDAGADALGFIFAESPRRVRPDVARMIIDSLPPFVVKVGVFVNEGVEEVRRVINTCGIDVVQFHGSESPELIEPFFPRSIKAFKMKERSCIDTISSFRIGAALLDSYDPEREGGTGKTFNWEWAREAKNLGLPVILSGGLTPDNVQQAIGVAEPYAVDVAGGVERSPGRKDPEKVRAFVRNARECQGSA